MKVPTLLQLLSQIRWANSHIQTSFQTNCFLSRLRVILVITKHTTHTGLSHFHIRTCSMKEYLTERKGRRESASKTVNLLPHLLNQLAQVGYHKCIGIMRNVCTQNTNVCIIYIYKQELLAGEIGYAHKSGLKRLTKGWADNDQSPDLGLPFPSSLFFSTGLGVVLHPCVFVIAGTWIQ